MSYKCEVTGVVVPPHTPKHTIISERRNKDYRNSSKEDTGFSSQKGWEIVKEMVVSPEYYTSVTGLPPSLPKLRSKLALPEREKFTSKTKSSKNN